jgi:hypothetical protein
VPRPFVLHLETSFGFLSLLTAAAFLGTPAERRAKIGVVLFALPGALHVAAIVLARIPQLRSLPVSGDLSRWGELCLLAAAASAPFTLAPRRAGAGAGAGAGGWMIPLAAAVAFTLILSVALGTRYDLVQAIALYGLRLDMPRLASGMGLAYLAAALGWTYAVVQMLRKRGGMRLGGYGLLLLAIAGYQVGSPVELAVSLLGLFALSVGELRARADAPASEGARGPVPLGPADWRALVGRVATAVDDGSGPEGTPADVLVADEDDREISVLRGHRRGRATVIRVLRRRGRLVELEINVGDPGHREVTATIERHRSWLARSPEQRLPLPRAKTGDPLFDQKFSVHGQAPLHSEGLRRQVMRQGDGVLSLWHGTAARYRAVAMHGGAIDPASVDPGAVAASVDAMLDLVAIDAAVA